MIMTVRARFRLFGGGVMAVSGALLAVALLQPVPVAHASSWLVPVTQDYTDGCVPAVSSMFLSAFGVHVSQDVLSAEMLTRQHHGTFGPDALRVLNGHLAPRFTVLSTSGKVGAGELGRLLRLNLRERFPVMLWVTARSLPWRRSDRVVFVHDLLVMGMRGSVVTVWDPEVRALRGGFHQVPLGVLDGAVLQAMMAFRAE